MPSDLEERIIKKDDEQDARIAALEARVDELECRLDEIEGD